MGFPNISGTVLGGPHYEDASILGSILGTPSLGKDHMKATLN